MNKKLKRLTDIYITFFKLGAFSFGGGYAMIHLIEHEVVENKKWMEKEKIVDVFSVAGALPGAIGLNSSAFVGYSIEGIPGAIIAILGNLTPSVIIVLTLSILFSFVQDNPIVQQIFYGIRPTIIGLICYAGFKIGKTAIKDYWGIILAVLAFIMATFFNIQPIPLIAFGAISGIGIMLIKDQINSKRLEKKILMGDRNDEITG